MEKFENDKGKHEKSKEKKTRIENKVRIIEEQAKKEKKEKKNTNQIINSILNLFLIIFISLFIYSSMKIGRWYLNSKQNEKVKEEISKAITFQKNENGEDEYMIDFESLKAQNPDTVAYLKVNNTDVDFAVVKTTNNGYYLSRNFNKEYNLGGWIFADYKNRFDGTDKNIVVYGHNMRDGSMFGTLKDILKEEWYNNEENYEIIFISENEKSIYQVFSIYQIEVEDYYIKTNFANDEDFKNFLNTIKNRSVKDFNIELTENENILTLSTCSNNNQYRVVLHARKVK